MSAVIGGDTITFLASMVRPTTMWYVRSQLCRSHVMSHITGVDDLMTFDDMP